MPDPAQTSHWIITDGGAGNRRQAEALAALLGLPARHLELKLAAPWRWLAPRLTAQLGWGVGAAGRELLTTAPPGLVIGCGRQAATVTRWLRSRHGARCRSIQILDPRVDPRHWDLVIAPAHDGLRGANVITTLGSLHPVDSAWLQAGREAWPQLASLPAPRIGLLLGGPRHGLPLNPDWLVGVLHQLATQLQRSGGSVLLVASRRTPDPLKRLAADFASQHPSLCWSGPEHGPNPYAGVLGWAQRLVVTPDSVNMLSEACATGLPVTCPAPAQPLPRRLAAFQQALRQRGLLRDWDDASPPAPAWRESAVVAAEVRRRLQLDQA